VSAFREWVDDEIMRFPFLIFFWLGFWRLYVFFKGFRAILLVVVALVIVVVICPNHRMMVVGREE
jgi:hypothetical protein